MTKYRFVPDKGLRRKGEPYTEFDTDVKEIDEEWFSSREEFCEAIAARIYETLNNDDEGEDDTE
jgi:hypothetical protein